ncbi:MAG: hypothetical protein LIO91_04130 [Bacteroidales bacterium]|nr:hypothetical protein [Bacteroidales bacterium]
MARLAKFILLSLLSLTRTYASAIGEPALDGHTGVPTLVGHSAERVLFNLQVSKDHPLSLHDSLTPPYILEIRAKSNKPWAVNWGKSQLLVQWQHSAKGTDYDQLSIQVRYNDEIISFPTDAKKDDLPISLWVKVDSIITIAAGYDTLSEPVTVGNRTPRGNPFFISTWGKVDVEELRITFLDEPEKLVTTGLSREDVMERLAATSDPIERLWVYFDRENDPDRVRLGGKYTLATLANVDGGYDIIYMDGAEIQADKWQPGMLKGKLTPTSFTGRYNLMWIDAVMQPMDSQWEGQAEVNLANGILTLYFPLISAQLRFNSN